MSDLKIDMNDMIMADSPIRFPGLFGDWTFTASSKAIDVGHGVYWYGILIALGLLLALLLCMKERVKYGISEDNLYDGLLWGIPIGIVGADEPYRELVYGSVKVPFIPCLYKNTIVCYSYSKSLSLPGERIGYVYVPSFAEDSTAVYATVSGAARAMGHVCPPTLIQKVVGLCAQEQPDLQAYDENRTLLYDSLRAMGYECAKPDGAFYLFVKAPGGDAGAFSEKAKREHNLLVVPADGFGCPGYFRLSYCVSNEMIRRSLPAFKAMMEAYQ